MRSCLFNCTVFHQRYSPREYGFTSRVFMWLLDLDEIDGLCEKIPFLGHNTRNLYSFRDDDHLYLGKDSLRENVETYLRRQGVSTDPARILLLTNLRTFGYVFNPVSFFFCFDENGEALACIAEVHNTFGELKPFFLGPENFSGNDFRAEHRKEFYISPFSVLDDHLQIRAKLPGDRVSLSVNSRHEAEDKPFFRASLAGNRTPLTTSALLGFSLRFPFVTLKVISLIHWHAFRLYLRKVPFLRKSAHPEQQKGIVPKRNQVLDSSSS